jgi:hypothetical protein
MRALLRSSDSFSKMESMGEVGLPESCEFWSIRSRWTWWFIGGGGAAAFIALEIEAIVVGNRSHASESVALVIGGVALAFCIAVFVNAYFVGHLTLSPERLTYRAFLRTRSYSRKGLLRAETQVRFRPPSPRRLYMPVLIEQSGSQYSLGELNTPLTPDLYVLKSKVRVGSTEEASQESLNGLAEWINSWIASSDWIKDRDFSGVGG